MKLNIVPGKFCQLLVHWALSLWGNEVGVSLKQNTKSVSQRKSPTNESDGKNVSVSDQSYLEYEQKYLVSYGQKTAKGDDEEVPVELWDRNILRKYFCHLTYDARVDNSFRILGDKIGMRWYLYSLRKSLFGYLNKTYGKNF